MRLEHEVEGGAQQAAERHLPLGQAADPQVDVVETAEAAGGIGTEAVQEVDTVRRHGEDDFVAVAGKSVRIDRSLDRRKRSPWPLARLPASVVSSGDRAVRAVGGDEVDERFGVAQVLGEVDPAHVRLELAVGRHLVELARAPR